MNSPCVFLVRAGLVPALPIGEAQQSGSPGQSRIKSEDRPGDDKAVTGMLGMTMQTSIATVSLSGGLAEKLEAIAAAGFKGVEIFESDLLSFNGTPREVARMVEGLGLEIVTFQPFRDFEGMPEPQRSRTFARAERKFDLMGELGCRQLLVCSNVSPDSLGGIERAAADLHELGERAAKRGIRVGFEALAWGRHINDYRDSWEVVRRADHPAIGLMLDSFHIFSRQDRPEADPLHSARQDLAGPARRRAVARHGRDAWSRHFRCFPGQGEFPLIDFMDAVSATGYGGLLSLEIFNDQFRAGSPRGVAIDGQRSLVYLMDQLRGRRRRARRSRAAIPPRAKCLGIEFLEFAADDRAAEELAGLFAGLGFRKVGRAQVEGGDALVARRRSTSSSTATRKASRTRIRSRTGPSVCAICLKVDDAPATLDRAEKLRDTPFRQAVGPGELEIPAVRGLGGSLLYFVDPKSELGRVVGHRFRHAPQPARRNGGAGLTSVDHVSQSMHYEEMLSWLLFYTSLLDVTKTPQLDVIDPGGIVQQPGGADRGRRACASRSTPRRASRHCRRAS